MHPDYTNLVCSTDSQHLMNMNVIMSTSPNGGFAYASPAPINAPITVEAKNEAPSSNRLADFDRKVNDGEDFVDRACIQIINQIIAFDQSNIDKYYLEYNKYSDSEAYVTVRASEPATTELIQRFSFNVGIWDDMQLGKLARIYVGGLFVNQKYSDVGSTLLGILKSALKSLVSIAQLNTGYIELYSVETAILFYIKQGFMVRDLVSKKDPQSKVYSTQRILNFALQENNIEIMKQYAGVTQDNFVEFIEFLLKNTKYGKFFKAYFDAKETQDAVEQSVMESRFISSLFDTNMIYKIVRDPYTPKVNLKPLTM